MVRQFFTEYLSQFEGVLSNFGYSKFSEEVCSTGNYKDGLSVEYINNKINRKITIAYIIWKKDEDLSLSMFMFELPRNGTFFSLYDFLTNHNLNDKIISECPPEGDFEFTIREYFQGLESMFNHELKDQITGKTFENHMTAQIESWNQHRDVAYQMELDAINKFKNSKKSP